MATGLGVDSHIPAAVSLQLGLMFFCLLILENKYKYFKKKFDLETILVTGGAGFIGANFVCDCINTTHRRVVNLDKLTYAGNPENLSTLKYEQRHIFVRGDIGDGKLVGELLSRYKPSAIINFAAESHVDRSIYGPEDFIQTNVVGTFHLLESVRDYWLQLGRNM